MMRYDTISYLRCEIFDVRSKTDGKPGNDDDDDDDDAVRS